MSTPTSSRTAASRFAPRASPCPSPCSTHIRDASRTLRSPRTSASPQFWPTSRRNRKKAPRLLRSNRRARAPATRSQADARRVARRRWKAITSAARRTAKPARAAMSEVSAPSGFAPSSLPVTFLLCNPGDISEWLHQNVRLGWIHKRSANSVSKQKLAWRLLNGTALPSPESGRATEYCQVA